MELEQSLIFGPVLILWHQSMQHGIGMCRRVKINFAAARGKMFKQMKNLGFGHMATPGDAEDKIRAKKTRAPCLRTKDTRP